MTRCLAFLFALCCACLSVSSACLAQTPDTLHFTLEPTRSSGDLRVNFRGNLDGDRHNNWSTDFRTSDLVGFDVAGFRAAGTRPLRFALIREAGRLDCIGHGGESYAAGNCTLTSDPAFMQLLASRGIGRPNRQEQYSLVALDVRRSLIDAVAAARYPTPTIENLIEMTAVGVNGGYVSDLSRLGYRPDSIQNLVQFRALGITPEWIGSFARMGYANLPADDLVQLKALGVTADYIGALDRLGYRHLPADDLVQLKALGVTPQWIADFQRAGYQQMPVDYLVQLKALNVTPDYLRAMGPRSPANNR